MSQRTKLERKAFCKRLAEVKILRDFIWDEGLELSSEDREAYILGPLADIYSGGAKIDPTGDDWREIEDLCYRLNRAVQGDSRAKYRAFVRRNIPPEIPVVALGLLAIAFLVLSGFQYPERLAGF